MNIDQDQQRALDIHNQARDEVGSEPLTWCWQLAEEAQTWAKYIVGNDLGEAQGRLRPPGSDISQNMATSTLADPPDPLTATASLWYAEKRYWHGKEIHQYCRTMCKHICYTQMVWDKTTHLGMASASNGKSTIVVARYWPAGNVMGERPMEEAVKGDSETNSSESMEYPRRNTRHPCA